MAYVVKVEATVIVNADDGIDAKSMVQDIIYDDPFDLDLVITEVKEINGE